MASPGNRTSPGGGVHFDMQKLFQSSAPVPPPAATSSNSVYNPNIQATANNDYTNMNPPLISTPFQPPSCSYPPPTVAAVGPYTYLSQTSPFQHHHPHYLSRPMYNLPADLQEDSQRSMSCPTPALQHQAPVTSSPHHQNFQNPSNFQNPDNHGARLMALLSAPPSTLEIPPHSAISMPQILPTSSSGSDFSMPQNINILPQAPALLISNQGPPMVRTSGKLPKGRHLAGDNLLYDLDARLPGEMQPQLEVTPITKYGSDPGLVLGRQIAVNKSYICYGLKLGAIRVLNINTALRSLLKGLSQRVTDMAFFAEDVHLLASASVDGRVYVWKITEGPDEEEKHQIIGRTVLAIQITVDEESVHPKVCWHGHKQEVLVVGIGRHILKIDITKVGKGEKFSAEEPLKCSLDRLIEGVQLVGSHDGEVTDLSMSQWMTTRLVSSSVDGTIRIWEDRKSLPIAILQPHGGYPVNSVTFLAAPHRPDHIILITGGPLNREIKLWVSASVEGWLLPVGAESWHCTQTLELKSSDAQPEDTFFNQVMALSQAGLLLLANAKRNSIYAVHLNYGPNPATTCMDYIAEFTVTMRILSFTATSESVPRVEQTVQVYCVQTHAIQQYALDLSQCLPPNVGNATNEKCDSSFPHDVSSTDKLSGIESSGIKPVEVSTSSSAPKASIKGIGSDNSVTMMYPVNSPAESPRLQESASSGGRKPTPFATVANNGDLLSVTSSSLPLSPRLSGTLSDLGSPPSFEHPHTVNVHDTEKPKVVEYSVDRQMDTIPSDLPDLASLGDDSRTCENIQHDISMALNSPNKFRHPTHLVTPSEILMANSPSEVTHTTDTKNDGEINIQDMAMSSDKKSVEVDVKVVDETKFSQNNEHRCQEEHQPFVTGKEEKSFCTQASDIKIDTAGECHALSPKTYVMEENRQFTENGGTEPVAQHSIVEVQTHKLVKDASTMVIEPSTPSLVHQPASNSKGKKGKNPQGSEQYSPLLSAFNSTESTNEPRIGYSTVVESQISSMQMMLKQLLTLQKEMQKQMITMAAVPVTKEGKRIETALGRNLEKTVKANADALCVRVQEENVKREKASGERIQQVTNIISNSLNKDLPAIIEKTMKRELNAVGQSVARTIIPTIEKSISTSIAESFQKGVGDKAVTQLERSVNSKLEATVSRQILTQFQTSGKQVLQDTMKSALDASVIPAFEASCRVMFEQVDATFRKGMAEHTAAAQQQFDASHSSLALILRDAVNTASTMSQTLSNELLDGHRKLVDLAIAGPNSQTQNPLMNQLSSAPMSGLNEKLEIHVDPTKELSRLVAERKYEEAFTTALQSNNVTVVSWLCSQVDLTTVLLMNPLPVSQGVLLSLLQQLACDISTEMPRKLTWMRDVLTAINPTDPVIMVHVRPIFEQVYQILNHHRNIPTVSGMELSNIRLIMHVLNSMLLASK